MAAPAPGPTDARQVVRLIAALKASGEGKDMCNARLVAWYDALAGEIRR